ncbi:MAG: hypothetical protein R6V75_01095 [Bacteroidales bacterium]
MKKTFLSAILLMVAQLAIAGGLIIRPSQSAQYVRMLSRNASTGLDAAYYNPAGLGSLGDGMHLSINNMFMTGEKLLVSGYDYLSDPEYTETIRQMFLPTGFAVYEAGKVSASIGFGHLGGLGSINWDQGLLSMEIPVARLPRALPYQARTDYQVEGYQADIEFLGKSSIWGIQGGITYRVADYLSVYGGIRYLVVNNSYAGSVGNIRLMVDGEMVEAAGWMTARSTDYKNQSDAAAALAVSYSGFVSQVQNLITGGAGSFTLNQVQSAGYISSAQRAEWEAALRSAGYTPAQVASMNIMQVKLSMAEAADNQSQLSIGMATAAAELAVLASQSNDRELSTGQKGGGITPVLGINLTPLKNLNIGIRYEFKTSVELTNQTFSDDWGLYPDKDVLLLEVPAHLAFGIGYKAGKMFEGQFSCDLGFDKGGVWGKNQRDWISIGADSTQVRDRLASGNSLGLGLGLQVNLTDDIGISLGGNFWKPAVHESYQSDFAFVQACYSFGLGMEWRPNEQVSFDFGFSKSYYQPAEAHYFEPVLDDWYIDTFNLDGMFFSIGLTYRTIR